MKILQLFLISSLVFVLSCNKNQKVVKELDGSWKVTAATKNGKALPDSTFAGTVYKFEKCRVKKGACPGSVTEDGKTLAFTYSISEKGTKITISVFGIPETSEILEHSKTKFRWKSDDGKDVEETTIEKM